MFAEVFDMATWKIVGFLLLTAVCIDFIATDGQVTGKVYTRLTYYF
jgi:hypothetical protein